MKVTKELIETMKKIALTSEVNSFKHVSAIFCGKKLVSFGINQHGRTISGVTVPSIHSEVDAIRNARKRLHLKSYDFRIHHSNKTWLLQQSRFKGKKVDHGLDPDKLCWSKNSQLCTV